IRARDAARGDFGERADPRARSSREIPVARALAGRFPIQRNLASAPVHGSLAAAMGAIIQRLAPLCGAVRASAGLGSAAKALKVLEICAACSVSPLASGDSLNPAG